MAVPTIDDVAKEAGVSKSTVSRVLSGNYSYIREETRQSVQKAIDRLGFRPSSIARSLTSKRTQTIGILISDIGNPFYSDVIHGVEDVAITKSYNIFLGNTNYDLGRGMDLIRSFIDRRVDGVLIMSSTMSDEWLDELARSHMPVVALDWEVKAASGNLSSIAVNFRNGIQEAVRHLLSLGHRKFVHVCGPLTLQTARQRRDDFLEELQANGISSDQVQLIGGDLTIEGGRKAAQAIINHPLRPTAVFAANDLMAIGILSAVQSLGMVVPDELSIVGLDDIWLAAQTDPPLTTVALPRYEIGSLAVDILFELLNRKEDQPPINTRVDTTLKVRKSTAAPSTTR